MITATNEYLTEDLTQLEMRYRYFMRAGKYEKAQTMKLRIADEKARRLMKVGG